MKWVWNRSQRLLLRNTELKRAVMNKMRNVKVRKMTTHSMQNTPISMVRVRLWVRFRVRVRLGVVQG